MPCLLYAEGLGLRERWKGEYTVPLILNLGARWRWMVSFTPRPLYVRQRTPTPINKEVGWDPEPVLDVLLRGFEPRTIQPATNLYTDNAIPVDC